jgi:hypothetical protein
MLTAARGAVVPGLAPGKLNVEYVAMDSTLHSVPLADAARVRLAHMQPSRRFCESLPGLRWLMPNNGRHDGGAERSVWPGRRGAGPTQLGFAVLLKFYALSSPTCRVCSGHRSSASSGS